jgi:hypothetical protein
LRSDFAGDTSWIIACRELEVMKKEISKDHLLVVWSRFKSGDKEAYTMLYNLHIDALYSYGTKLCKDTDTVKDSLQELFLELFLNR